MPILKTILVDLTAKILLASVTFTLLLFLLDQAPVVPDWSINQCAPLTANPKRIWAFWKTGPESLSKFNAEAFKMWRHFTTGWEVRLLHYGDPEHECHIFNFISPDMLPRTFINMSAPLASDAVRIALLRIHGGIYMDISVILLERPENIFWDRLNLPDGDPKKLALGGFYIDVMSKKNTRNGFELWMIGVLPNEPIVVAWHEKFLQLLDESPKPFIRNEQTGEINPILEGLDHSFMREWHINYLCAMVTLQAALAQNQTLNNRFTNMTDPYNVEDTAFRVLARHDWIRSYFYRDLSYPHRQSSRLFRSFTNNTHVIKFTSAAREFKSELYSEWGNPHNLLTKIRRSVSLNSAKLATNISRIHHYHYDPIIYVPS